MPRLPEVRQAAEPSSELQRAKYARMLTAARELGNVNDYDRVQMLDVARRAKVAVATLYRYFPSKPHLFAALLSDQIDLMGGQLRKSPDLPEAPDEAAAIALIRALHSLMRRPILATSMIRAINGGYSQTIEMRRIDEAFRDVLLQAIRIDAPTEREYTLVRLLSQQWFGITQSCLNGHIDLPAAESDIRIACRLLLAPLVADSPVTDVPEAAHSLG